LFGIFETKGLQMLIVMSKNIVVIITMSDLSENTDLLCWMMKQSRRKEVARSENQNFIIS
jgi:hypothetical protein